ncbi:MAG: hypothetical protein PHX70_07885 [Clostridium sp.]|nr:hypothetical protein [Clostridium sp.]
MIKNTCGLEYVKDSYMKLENEELIKMYPDINLQDKYILFIQSELWYPYLTKEICGNIKLIYENNIREYKTKIIRPYPNKSIRVISMVNGRKVCSLGLPIVFDSYEDLKKVKSILIKWKIEIQNADNIKEKHYVQVLYNVDFKYVENKKIYSVYSQDTLLHFYDGEDKLLKQKYDEFEKIIFIANAKNEDFSVRYLKGHEEKGKRIEEEAFTTIMENIKLPGFFDIVSSDEYKPCIIYSYFSNETLEPSDIADNLPHY